MNATLNGKTAIVFRWLIACALVWAALGKLANPQEFHNALLAYRIPFPAAVLRTTAVVLPWLELLSGLLLAANLRRAAALQWACALFAIFTVATGQAWARGLPIGCGCFDLRLLGIARESGLAHAFESPAFAFFRAAILAALAFHLLRREVAESSLEPAPARAR